jgi:hypothetical protein
LCTEEFYDPQVPFFKIFFDNNPEKFPTQPYDTDAWLSFLRLIGLQGIEILNDVNLIKDYLTLIMNSINEFKMENWIKLLSDLYENIFNLNENDLLSVIYEFNRSIKFLISNINLSSSENINLIKPVFILIYSIIKKIFETDVDQNEVANFFEDIKSYKLIFHEYENNEKTLLKLSLIENFIEKDLRKFEQIENQLYIYPDYLFEYKDMFINFSLNIEVNYELVLKFCQI